MWVPQLQTYLGPACWETEPVPLTHWLPPGQTLQGFGQRGAGGQGGSKVQDFSKTQETSMFVKAQQGAWIHWGWEQLKHLKTTCCKGEDGNGASGSTPAT